MFLWNSLTFSMIQRMLAIWSLVPLPFLNPAWTSGSSRFMYYWSLMWKILSITLLGCVQFSRSVVSDPLRPHELQHVRASLSITNSRSSLKLTPIEVVLKILQARLQQYMTWAFPDVKFEFLKGRGSRDQIANIRWIIEKARKSKEINTKCFKF